MARTPRTPRIPRVPAAGPDAPKVVPIATNFDFLEGAFARAEKARRTILGAAMGALVALSAMTLVGVQAAVVARTDRATTEQVQSSNTKTISDIARLDQAGGISAEQLRSHASTRQSGLLAAVKSETDVAALLNAVNGSLPAGVTVKSIDFDGPQLGASTKTPGAGASTPGAGTSGAAGSAGTGSAGSAGSAAGKAKPPTPRTLKVVGTATDFAAIGAWSKALAQVPGVANVAPTWTGGGQALQVTLTATLSDAANSQRSKTAAAADQYGFPKGSGS